MSHQHNTHNNALIPNEECEIATEECKFSSARCASTSSYLLMRISALFGCKSDDTGTRKALVTDSANIILHITYLLSLLLESPIYMSHLNVILQNDYLFVHELSICGTLGIHEIPDFQREHSQLTYFLGLDLIQETTSRRISNFSIFFKTKQKCRDASLR